MKEIVRSPAEPELEKLIWLISAAMASAPTELISLTALNVITRSVPPVPPATVPILVLLKKTELPTAVIPLPATMARASLDVLPDEIETSSEPPLKFERSLNVAGSVIWTGVLPTM